MASVGQQRARPPVSARVRATVAVAFVLSLLTPAVGPVAAAGGTVTVGSNDSDPLPKAGFAAMMAYCAAQTGVAPIIHTYDHAAYQNAFTSYLSGTPDDVVSWGGGERMRFFAGQGLLTPLTDVWAGIAGSYSPVMKAASTGYDGRQYLVPVDDYPWVVLYRRSVFATRGYALPKTIGDFVALASRMQADGLVPLAFGDAEGWPAMGMFDILDMRLNGYAFHMDLMAGRAKWTDPRVTSVFDEWAKLLPLTQPGAVGRTWQQGATALFSGQAGMYFMGTFAADSTSDPAVLADLGAFAFPVFGNQWDAESAIDAPVDGLMLSKAPANVEGAKALLACAGTGPAQLRYIGSSHGSLAAASDADTSAYSSLQRQAAAILASSGRAAQFLDRDARPDFVGPDGMQAFLADFVADPTQDIPALQRRIQAYRDSLPPTWRVTLSVKPSKPSGTLVRGSAVTFAASVRPLGPTRATVRFAVYQRIGLVSRLALARDVVADAGGRASFRYSFGTAGSFYVRAKVVPDHTYLGTAFGSPIRYLVR